MCFFLFMYSSFLFEIDVSSSGLTCTVLPFGSWNRTRAESESSAVLVILGTQVGDTEAAADSAPEAAEAFVFRFSRS